MSQDLVIVERVSKIMYVVGGAGVGVLTWVWRAMTRLTRVEDTVNAIQNNELKHIHEDLAMLKRGTGQILRILVEREKKG